MFSPFHTLLYFSIAISVILTFSSSSLPLSWIGLELNTLAFIPLLLSSSSISTSEAAIKYFLTQTLASIFLLLSIIFPNFILLFSLSLLIKLAAAPFHSWLPSLTPFLSWSSMFVILTIQKLNPLIICLSFSSFLTTSFMNISIIFSLLMGSIMGLTQTSLRLIFTYSSINHMGWLLAALYLNQSFLWTYYFIYILLLLPIFLTLNSFNSFTLAQLPYFSKNSIITFTTSLLLLSLGGLPPFLGFLPKWMVLQELISHSFFVFPLTMIFSSLLTLFFYLRISFNSFLFSKQFLVLSSSLPSTFPLISFTTLISLSGLMFTFLF